MEVTGRADLQDEGIRAVRAPGIADKALRDAIDRAERGLIDADLGGGLIKQRVARPGQGRSSGYRTVIAWRVGRCCFFVHGFAKSRKADLAPSELRDLQDLGALLVGYSDAAIKMAVAAMELVEVRRG